MKTGFNLKYLLIVTFVVAVGLLGTVSCVAPTQSPAFYNAGAANFTPTGSEFTQYFLYRFDTGAAERTLTFPSAADIISAASSPIVGGVLVFSVAADGANAVVLQEGANGTLKPSASSVAGNATRIFYVVFDDVSSGSEAVTVY